MFNLKAKLAKTRESFVSPLKSLFGRAGSLSPEDEDTVEEVLLGADVGVEASERILDALRESKTDNYRDFMRREFLELLGDDSDMPLKVVARPRAIIVIGVNGVGKTTSIAKLSSHLVGQGESVLLAACDTFRAAAADQLNVWADRVGIDIIRHEDVD